jgi:hypothetical protein
MEKKKYRAPRIEWIPLDNEISLALASAPPEGPGELGLLMPQHTDTNPYKSDIV